MEGISHESCSLAGTLGLGKLIAFYDDNGISIDGEVEGWFTDDTPGRFRAYGWQVIEAVDGHDAEAVRGAIEAARAEEGRPTLICCRTVIGKGAPNKAGSESCHGAPLGADEVAATREALGWTHPPFEVPEDIYAGWDARAAGSNREAAWNDAMTAYAEAHPGLAAELSRRLAGELPANFGERADAWIAECRQAGASVATRKASQQCLNAYGALLPEFLGGSADLAGSNLTLWSGCKGVSPSDASGNYVYYGVREFGMSAIMNGITLHGGFKAYGATFLMFMEYARNAVRMAALMKINPIFVYTHDSIGLGEDGPTHQPVEQVSILRLTPRMSTWRPCDAVESAVAWKLAIQRKGGPTALIFSRQNAPHMSRTEEQLHAIEKGAYVLRDCDGTPDAIIIGTGTEVELAVSAAEQLASAGRKVRVVSMPSMDVFDAQDAAYKESVLPDAVKVRVAVEAGVSSLWPKYVGLHGKVIGVDSFGESAPAPEVYKTFGVTAEAVAEAVNSLL
jgi:transketolase